MQVSSQANPSIGGTGVPSSRGARSALLAALILVACLVFAASVASAAPPTATIDPAGTVGYTTAQVSGTVDPADQETHYSFEYSADPASEGWSGFSSEGPIAAGTGVTNVATELTGLKPGTEYQVRLAALNFAEFIEYFSAEPNSTFTTKVPTKPAIASTFAAAVSFDVANLRAQINPNGADTGYYFEYGVDTSYGAQVPATPVDIGSGGEAKSAAARLTDISPGTTYHYRVVAINSVDTTLGPDRTFTTPLSTSATQLPDGRAYEQVTPVDKSGQDGVFFDGTETVFAISPQVAADGDRAAYLSFGAFSGSPVANPYYLATREAADWSSRAIIPPQSTVGAPVNICIPQYAAYSSDLSRGVLEDGLNVFGGCGADDPPVVPGEPRGVQNLFLRDNASETYQLINLTPSGVAPADANFQAASTDLRHVLFDEPAPLTPDATSGDMLYEWSDGSVTLVGLIPVAPAAGCSGSACTPVDGARVGGTNFSEVALVDDAVSEDGSRVFFTANGNLYLREGDTTTQVDVSHGPGSSGGGTFMTAAEDGTSVLFTDPNQLTDDASPSGEDLYRYEVGSGQLSNLTPDSTDPGGAAVQGLVGASDDASYVYFVANGVLTTNPSSQGQTASPGHCIKSYGSNTLPCNLYLWHGGTTKFIATLVGAENTVWNGSSKGRVSADGTGLAFISSQSLTGYDNSDLQSGNPDGEVYLYDADSDELVCASCNPSGARPLGSSTISGVMQRLRNFEPRGAPFFNNFSLQRNLSADGSRLFFDSDDALVPTDTNHRRDVYEYEPAGTGTCTTATSDYAAAAGGCIDLISSGRSEGGSYFYDASTNGDDVFFLTRSQLVGQDTDGLQDLYDARAGGGLASQNPPPPPPPCSGESCRGPGAEPGPTKTVGSDSVSGDGNAHDVCSATERQARKLRHRAKLLRRRANHAGDEKRARRLDRKADRLSEAARNVARNCIRSHGKGSK